MNMKGFNIPNIFGGNPDSAEAKSKIMQAQTLANEITGGIGNLQTMITAVVNAMGGLVYIMRKKYPELYELYKTGLMVNEYLNVKLNAYQLEMQPTGNNPAQITEKFEYMMKLEAQIKEYERKLMEIGNDVLDDAKEQFDLYLKDQAAK